MKLGRWARMGMVMVVLAGTIRGSRALAQEVVAPKVDRAMIRGLEFLALHQQEDGAFEEKGQKVAITALSVMGFLASGNVPGDGRYGQAVRRGVDYLIDQFPADGYVGKVDGSRMYGQGIATLALAEAYGVERDPVSRAKIRAVLAKSVEVIEAAQAVQKDAMHAGGWRYEPGSVDSDLSLSGWNVLALRACNNVGVRVKREYVERAAAYVLRCYKENEKGFAYQPWQPASAGMTGVAIVNLCLMDRSASREVTAATGYLMSHAVSVDTRFAYYSSYYMTQAAFQVGEPAWSSVWKGCSEQLVSLQDEDGGWPQSRSSEEPGRTYATAMAVLTLSVPNRLLPIHQR